MRPGCASLMSGTAGCPRRSAGLADPGKRERGLVGFCACLFWQRTDARPFSRRRRAPRYCHCPPPLLPLCDSGLTAVQHLLRYPQEPLGKQIGLECKMYSYRARVHQSHAEATAKAAAVVVAYVACNQPRSPDADFRAALDELDAQLRDLETAVSALNRTLPPEIGSKNELSRHVKIGRHKVDERRPWEWRGDP